ncbi:MAG: LytR C-terminal domain-containing protein [Actinobacteria bacterium]|nr:LytR C-terminal domain-containing protein [Actinomycetota bacterium]MBW3649289.1 LytR C-terminal domain-containing protein [Actinomycetota bacterium]
MTPAVPRLPHDWRRLQALVAVAGLVGAVAVTAALVTTPASSVSTAVRPNVEGLAQRPRVEIRGGNPYRAFQLADRLAADGATMTTVQPAAEGSSPADTAIVYYDRRHAATAAQIRKLLGRGTVRREQVFEPRADVTIVLGKEA